MILVFDCGSQSIKWKLFKDNLKVEKEEKIRVKNPRDYQNILIGELNKLKKYQKSISKVGHRVVHGGEKFRDPIKITTENLKNLEKYNSLAPLHNPFNVSGIKAAQKIFPKSQQFAVFDTEFYKDLPKRACIYALPEDIRKRHSFRRLGFHGISHEYVTKEAARKFGKPFGKLKIISCHLGGGSSITAIKNGKAIDTSMGFTPMEGLAMMTRSGDVDPGIVLMLVKNSSVEKANEILNYQSGINGICGISDMKEVLKAVKKRNKKAKLALEIFIYRIQKYIGAYFVILGGCDLLIFTGAIGSGSAKIRNMICKNLTILKNSKILAIKTDEELSIAKKIKGLKI